MYSTTFFSPRYLCTPQHSFLLGICVLHNILFPSVIYNSVDFLTFSGVSVVRYGDHHPDRCSDGGSTEVAPR